MSPAHTTTRPSRPRVSPYHLTPESQAVLLDEGRRIRAALAERRAQRELATGPDWADVQQGAGGAK